MKGFASTRAKVVAAAAVVPERNLIRPPPTHFTHLLTREQAYYFAERPGKRADGRWPAGELLLLISDKGSRYWRVADHRGIHAATARQGLKAR